MRTIYLLILALVIVLSALVYSRTQSQSTTKPEIISALESGTRTRTYVALWTLRRNNFAVPQVDFNKPYSAAEPELQKLVQQLAQLPQAELAKLDESLKYHWKIYSPIWSRGARGWTQ